MIDYRVGENKKPTEFNQESTQSNDYLTNETYAEYNDAAQWNEDQRHNSIKNSWSLTNLFLGIIAFYFLIQIVKEILLIIFAVNVGKDISEIIQLLS